MEAFQLADSLPIGLFMVNTEFRVVFWNSCFADWTGLEGESVQGLDCREIFPRLAEPRYQRRLENLFSDGLPVVLSYQLNGDLFSANSKIHPDRVHHSTITLLSGDSGPLALFTVEDLTEVSLSIKTARAALAEKTMLMRELNHRVKNNLNMMRSLINLQYEGFKDDYSRTIFRDLDVRISSISLLHEMLYKSDLADGVSLDRYLSSLCYNIFETFTPEGSGIRLDLDLGEEAVSSDMTLHIGLIISELLTNAIKYGMKDRTEGIISVKLASSDKELTLVIADDGPGLPPDFDVSALKSLGMKLVHLITDQLDGRIEVDSTRGARFTLHVPKA